VTDGGTVLAIEGAEGTDAMLQRIAGIRGARDGTSPSGVLAKGPKPGQELRVDMPAIGPRTVAAVADAGLAGMAIEADAVLLLDRAEAVRDADARGIAIEGLPKISATRPQPAAGEPADAGGTARTRVAGSLSPSPRDTASIEKGLAAVARLAPFETGKAVVVARAYILAIAAAETTLDMLERTRALRQWGVGARRRVGVLACRISAPAPEWNAASVAALLDRAAAAALAGVAIAGPAEAVAVIERAGGLADRHGLFLVTRREHA
jgi:DUF1009 family protein